MSVDPNGTYNTTTSRSEIRPLTGIRGVAALWVVFFHALPKFGPSMGLPAKLLIVDRGYLAVDLFFILSGFVLMMSSGGRFLSSWRPATRSFLVGRLTRILPLNAVVLLAIGSFSFLAKELSMAPARNALASFIASMLLVQTWWPGHSTDWNYPAWSLSAEWFAYATFPICAPIVLWVRSKFVAFGLAALLILTLGAMLLAKHSLSLDSTNGLAIPRCVLEFYAGAFLFRTIQLGFPIHGIIFTVVSLVGTLAVAVTSDTDLIVPIFFMGLVAASFSNDDIVTKSIFGNNTSFFLGEISFSMYLIHAPLLELVVYYLNKHQIIPRLWFLPLFFIFLISISYVSFQLIERPFHNLGKLLQRKILPPRLVPASRGGP